MIFKNGKRIKQKPFKTEKELQTYVEENLKDILNLEFVETEFAVGNFRIDTLAYDEENKAFKIIEFKNIKNHSLIDQGATYLNLMMDRKADFVLKYNEKKNKTLKISDIDWSSTRVIFISVDFTQYQLSAINTNMPFELYEVKKYENDIVNIEKIENLSRANTRILETITTENKNKINEVKVYTEEDHLNNVSEKTKELYENIKKRILDLGDVEINFRKLYVSFTRVTRFADIWVKKNYIDIYLNLEIGKLNDPFNISRDISYFKWYAKNKGYQIEVKNEDDTDKAMFLIKQAYDENMK